MVTKAQAYEAVLNSLDAAWTAVSKSADSWAKTPKVNPNLATQQAQIMLRQASSDIIAIAKQLARGSVERGIVEDIAVRLEAFKKVLTSGSILNPVELVEQWKNSVQNMLDDILDKDAEAGKVPVFKTLLKKLAA